MAVEAVVSVVVETLGNMLVEKAVFPKGVEGDVEWVRNELKRMQCFLKDAAKKQSDNDSIRNWISEIREVAYDAEDAIEKFVLNVETRGLQERCACFPDHLNNLNNIGKEIESIRKRLEDIEKSRLRYGIRDLGESSRTRSQTEVEWRRRVEYWKQDRDVVGLEKDVQLLLDGAILEKRGGLSVASIIGMGGIGKSTLAKKIYNHPKIAGRFECRAWVVVSSEFTAEDILKEILEKLEVPGDRLKLLERWTTS